MDKYIDELSICRQAVDKWGKSAQLLKAIEEFSELAAVIARHMNGQADEQAVIEELADASIMLDQLKEMIGVYVAEGFPDFYEWKERKLLRLVQLMNAD